MKDQGVRAVRRKELEEFLHEYLSVDSFDDDAINGLQVEGNEEIRTVVAGVSACAELFRKAAALGADAVVVHHGLFWKKQGVQPVRGILRQRLGLLFEAGMSLFAYHLPLDAHLEVGNNAVAARDLGLLDLQPFGEYRGRPIGFRGRLPEPLPASSFIARLEEYYGHKAFVVPAGPERIERVGIVSGGAASEAEQAAAAGLDAYVTGEPSEPVTYFCREAGITFAALGHCATERVGSRALAVHLERALGLKALFVEVENEA